MTKHGLTPDARVVIWEWRLAFILFFFLCWCIAGLFPWVITAVVVRGRGALLALPLALAAACAAGVLVPMLGQRDVTGFVISLFTAAVGGTAGAIGGIAFDRRLQITLPAPQPSLDHKLGARRPADADAPAPTSNLQPPAS